MNNTYKTISDSFKKEAEKLAIREILVKSESVSVEPVFEDSESSEITFNFIGSTAFLNVPVGFRVIIDFNKLASSIYDAGYRKEDSNGSKSNYK